MFERFRDSIITPAKIVDYRNDKVIWVILYVLFFAMLLSTRMIIDVVTYDGLSVGDQNILLNNLPTLNEDCGFTNATYVCDTEETTLLFTDDIVSFYLDSYDELQYDSYQSQYNVVIQDDKIHFIFAGSLMHQESLSTIHSDLDDFQFSLQSSDPDLFEAKVLSVVDSYIVGYKGIWGPMLIVVDILTAILLFFAFILLSAWMLRMRFREIPFKQVFVMTSYSATAMYLILIFNSLYNLSFFIVIILLIIAFRQTNQLSYEIMRRLRQRKP